MPNKIKLIPKPGKNDIRDQKNKISFMNYLINHPEQRFWQIVRNWSGYPFVLGSNHWNYEMFDSKYFKKNKIEIEDTFYWEGTPSTSTNKIKIKSYDI
jgi:hypothetical protein